MTVGTDFDWRAGMRSASTFAIVLLGGAITQGCSAYIGMYGRSFSDGFQAVETKSDVMYFDSLVDELRQKTRDVEPMLASEKDLRTPNGAQVPADDACLAQPVRFRFLWLSDVQLRQREVKLFSDGVSRNLDTLIRTFEHDPVQEEFDWALYLEHILAANTLAKRWQNDPAPLSFVMHTGDSVDAGTIEELYEFVYITNQLHLPWFQVIGNHDVDIFGNYRHPIGYTRAAGANFYPVGSVSSFLRMHGPERIIAGFGDRLLPIPGDADHLPTLQGHYASNAFSPPVGPKITPGSQCHGFDLSPGEESKGNVIDCGRFKGYYAFDVPTAPNGLPIRIIVLDSHYKDGWGAQGQLDGKDDKRQQVRWLAKMLEGGENRLNLIFSHHRPGELFDEPRPYFDHIPKHRVVWFSGHTHEHLVDEVTIGKWPIRELNTGSLLESPQLGRLVEVHGTESNACLVSRAFWGGLSAKTKADLIPDQSRIDKEIGVCDQAVLAFDKGDPKGRAAMATIRLDLAAGARCARLGGQRDFFHDRCRFGRPQSFDDAWKMANVLIPLSLPKERP